MLDSLWLKSKEIIFQEKAKELEEAAKNREHKEVTHLSGSISCLIYFRGLPTLEMSHSRVQLFIL